MDRKKKKRTNRRYHIKKNYNMSLEDEDFILDYQDNKCAICKNQLVSPYIDHDHQTNDIRGILCINCNSGLGQFKDSIENLEAAIKYLKRPIVFTNSIPDSQLPELNLTSQEINEILDKMPDFEETKDHVCPTCVKDD